MTYNVIDLILKNELSCDYTIICCVCTMYQQQKVELPGQSGEVYSTYIVHTKVYLIYMRVNLIFSPDLAGDVN